jgi:hypothetical protein
MFDLLKFLALIGGSIAVVLLLVTLANLGGR